MLLGILFDILEKLDSSILYFQFCTLLQRYSVLVFQSIYGKVFSNFSRTCSILVKNAESMITEKNFRMITSCLH